MTKTLIHRLNFKFVKFKGFNVGSEGKLTKEAFNSWFNNYYAEKNHQQFGFDQSNAFLEQMFEVSDVNNDGQMSFEE